MLSSCNPKFIAVRHIHYPVNPSSDHFHTDTVVPSSIITDIQTEIVNGERIFFFQSVSTRSLFSLVG